MLKSPLTLGASKVDVHISHLPVIIRNTGSGGSQTKKKRSIEVLARQPEKIGFFFCSRQSTHTFFEEERST